MTRSREEVEEVEGLFNEVDALLGEIDDLEENIEIRDLALVEVEAWLKTHEESLPKLAIKQLKKILKP